MYFVVLFILLFFVLQNEGKKKIRFNRKEYIISCIILILFAGLRYRIGMDTVGYLDSFQEYPDFHSFQWDRLVGYYDTDPLWLVLNILCKTIWNDFTLVQLVQASVVNVVVFIFVKKWSPLPFFTILLYYCLIWWNFCFEALREALAICFFLYAVDVLIEKKTIVGYYLKIWPIVFVHTFGMVTFLFPFLKYLRPNKTIIISIIVLLVAVLYFASQLENVVNLLYFLPDRAKSQLAFYIMNDMYNQSSFSARGYFSFIIGVILPSIYIICVLYKESKKKEEYGYFVPFIIMFTICTILRLSVPIFFRLTNYFDLMLLIGMSQCWIIKDITLSTIKKIMISLSVLIIVVFRLYQLSMPTVDDEPQYKCYMRYYPYNSIITKDYNKDTEYIFSTRKHN